MPYGRLGNGRGIVPAAVQGRNPRNWRHIMYREAIFIFKKKFKKVLELLELVSKLLWKTGQGGQGRGDLWGLTL